MQIDPPACMECRHYRGARSCAAFPDPGRIPDAIWLEGDPHTGPIAGDLGIRFEPAPGVAPAPGRASIDEGDVKLEVNG